MTAKVASLVGWSCPASEPAATWRSISAPTVALDRHTVGKVRPPSAWTWSTTAATPKSVSGPPCYRHWRYISRVLSQRCAQSGRPRQVMTP